VGEVHLRLVQSFFGLPALLDVVFVPNHSMGLPCASLEACARHINRR
jgi:hypothetical protein